MGREMAMGSVRFRCVYNVSIHDLRMDGKGDFFFFCPGCRDFWFPGLFFLSGVVLRVLGKVGFPCFLFLFGVCLSTPSPLATHGPMEFSLVQQNCESIHALSLCSTNSCVSRLMAGNSFDVIYHLPKL